MFNLTDAVVAANELGIKFDKFSIKDFLTGLNIELEHGLVDLKTNVTNDDLIMTAKIALAHLNEYNDYYNDVYGLPAMERELEKRAKEHF